MNSPVQVFLGRNRTLDRVTGHYLKDVRHYGPAEEQFAEL